MVARWFSRAKPESFEETIGRQERERLARVDAGVRGLYPETPVLYTRTLELLFAAKFPDAGQFANKTMGIFIDQCDEAGTGIPETQIAIQMLKSIVSIYATENLTEVPPNPDNAVDEVNAGGFRDILIRLHRKAENPSRTLKVLQESFIKSVSAITKHLPALALLRDDETTPTNTQTVPLIDLVPDIGTAIEAAIAPFYSVDAQELGLFSWLQKRLDANRLTASRGAKQPIEPHDFKGSSEQVVAAYLHDTFLQGIFTARMPFVVPLSRRLEHTAIVAGTGHGKTQLLQQIIASDLESADSPGMVVIDSTGAMVKRIQRLAVFNERLRDRILIIDPEDDPVPALNMFDVSNPRLQTYGRAVREEVETEIIGLFNYVFESLASELTGRMSTTFSFIVRLMLSIPGSTIHTLRELLEDDTDAFAPHIAKLDATAQAFFKNHFYSRPFRTTRASIAQRLYGIIQVPAFERMFSSTNRVDMYEELQRGTIILINTSTRLLKEDASPLFGRYMIARTLAAVFERAAIPENERRPAFLFVDEAAPYFDDTFEAMLTRVRQFKLGVVIAFQHLEQTSEKLRSAIASNTSVKMAGGLGYSDSRWLSREMHTTPEFLQAQKRDPRDPPAYTHFACHVRNYTDTAVSLKVPIGTLEAMPRMTDAEHDALRERNRARVSNPLPQTVAKAPVEKKPEPFTPAAPQRAPEKPPEPDSGTEAATDWR